MIQANGGRLKMCDLTVDNIRSGQNWKVSDPEELLQVQFGEGLMLEDVRIEETRSFAADDMIVYSTIFVTEDGRVRAGVMIKNVNAIEPGGDYCEIHDGKWREVGLVPNPNAPQGTEYVANPLEEDPSFDTMDNTIDNFREDNRVGFRKWASKLKSAEAMDTGG